ncbi:MAG TPA: Rrf2 family transcriptional regulator [archaeon]|nr:Rrf2 family transcriptional regulator [archaeon]
MISQTGQYAIRAMVFLAGFQDSRYRLAREISSELGIPQQYLSKILLMLARKGILQSQRGRQGGFRLKAPAREITLYGILDPIENLERVDNCILGSRACDENKPCPLHPLWGEVRDKYLGFLNSTRLDQLISAGIKGC